MTMQKEEELQNRVLMEIIDNAKKARTCCLYLPGEWYLRVTV